MSTTEVIVTQAGIDARELAARLQKSKVGELVEYRELTTLIGRDVTVHRHLLDSARRICMRDHNMVFRSVLCKGVRRLDNAETIDVVSVDRRKRIRSQSKKAICELSTVQYDQLERSHQISHNAGLAMFGAIHQSTETTHLRDLEAQVSNNLIPDMRGTLQLVGWISD